MIMAEKGLSATTTPAAGACLQGDTRLSSLLESCYLGSVLGVSVPVDHEARLQVRSLLAGVYPPGAATERRREQRYPFPKLFVLSPADADGQRRAGASITAAGKHLSETGLSFFHPDPIPYRWMIASLPKIDGHWIGFLVDLDWCRFTRQGWYESGGRLVRMATPYSDIGRSKS
jgi:hypothetical protein